MIWILHLASKQLACPLTHVSSVGQGYRKVIIIIIRPPQVLDTLVSKFPPSHSFTCSIHGLLLPNASTLQVFLQHALPCYLGPSLSLLATQWHSVHHSFGMVMAWQGTFLFQLQCCTASINSLYAESHHWWHGHSMRHGVFYIGIIGGRHHVHDWHGMCLPHFASISHSGHGNSVIQKELHHS